MVVQVSLILTGKVFCPEEVITPGFMYIVRSGVALYGGVVKTTGGVWGEDMILRSRLLHRYAAVAITYCQVYRLGRDQLMDIAFFFPEAPPALAAHRQPALHTASPHCTSPARTVLLLPSMSHFP